jgi:predicted outer membrane protein
MNNNRKKKFAIARAADHNRRQKSAKTYILALEINFSKDFSTSRPQDFFSF